MVINVNDVATYLVKTIVVKNRVYFLTVFMPKDDPTRQVCRFNYSTGSYDSESVPSRGLAPCTLSERIQPK